MRQCGSCTLCCKLLPVPEISKPTGERCGSQCRKGCAIYHVRPKSCREWSCLWLLDSEMHDMPRPDRCGFVIDMHHDYVVLRDDDTGEDHKQPCLQVWADAGVDPTQSPALRRMLERNKAPALIRAYRSGGFFIAPPSFTKDGWFIKELDSDNIEREHTPAEVAALFREIQTRQGADPSDLKTKSAIAL